MSRKRDVPDPVQRLEQEQEKDIKAFGKALTGILILAVLAVVAYIVLNSAWLGVSATK